MRFAALCSLCRPVQTRLMRAALVGTATLGAVLGFEKCAGQNKSPGGEPAGAWNSDWT